MQQDGGPDTLALPPQTSILDAGESWAIVLVTDNLGVQAVVLYDLLSLEGRGRR